MPERLNRQERKAQTRERLLDAAAQVFAERGFEAASIDEVAAAAGFTKGAVYSNFESKTDLVIALLKRRIETQSAMFTARAAGREPREIAADLLEPSDSIPDSDRQFLVLTVEFWLHAMRDERARELIAEQYETARTFVADFLVRSGYDALGADGAAPGTATAGGRLSPREMAIVIEALGTGMAMQAQLDPAGVRLGLESRVIAMLMGLPVAPAPGDPDRAARGRGVGGRGESGR